MRSRTTAAKDALADRSRACVSVRALDDVRDAVQQERGPHRGADLLLVVHDEHGRRGIEAAHDAPPVTGSRTVTTVPCPTPS